MGLLYDVREAHACGGCFHEPPPTSEPDSTVVTDHRIAFGVSPSQTVLWDQVRYSGNPTEFAWVLPVRAGAQIQLSQDAWIAALDASTQPTVQAPFASCPASGSGGGCTFGVADSANGAEVATSAGSAPPVQVVSESVVGPYDAVTVRSTQGQALGDWLRANGYAVPDAVQPIIDAYTQEGFDFIALKLRPGEGVQAMQPVRVVTPGADPSLPLRMVAAGVGPHVGIQLFVLSEGRYHPQNFPDAILDPSELTWDPSANSSNYETLANAAMAAYGGRAWLTESAGATDFTSLYSGYANGANPSLAQAYTSTCTPIQIPPPQACGQAAGGDAATSPEAADDAEAGSPDGQPGSSPAPSEGGACASTTVPCDDLALATAGILGSTVYVTRLRAFLPATALANDLVLEASPSQQDVSSLYVATSYTNPNYNPCPSGSTRGGSGCRTADDPRHLGDGLAYAMTAVFLGFSLTRRRRR